MTKETRSNQDQHRAARVTPASVTWNELNTPVSDRFDDVYYSTASGLDESRYVFLNSHRIEERWCAMEDHATSSFTIVETGFGTGLNFLATCEAWQNSPLQDARLHFVSVEKFPLETADLRKALSLWPTLAVFGQSLIEKYPPLVPGFHRIEFPDWRITLTLILDDVLAALPHMALEADAWYLDGFAPAKNPEMWQDTLFSEMARLSKPGATFATFTAAGVVRRGLQQAGFSVEKVKGFGRKRDMIIGALESPKSNETSAPVTQTPWFYSKALQPAAPSIRRALVIGAGLAGSNSARALAERGIDVIVADQHSAIASEASGNPAGITFTKLSPHDSPQNRFYQKAYLYAVETLERRLKHAGLTPGEDYDLNGVLRFAFSDKEKQEQSKLENSGLWPHTFAHSMNAVSCSELLGFSCEQGGFFIRKGGWLKPSDLCHVNLDHPRIEVITDTQINRVDWRGSRWHAETNGAPIEADAIVVANGFGANHLAEFKHLPLRSVRGQITYVPATKASQRALKHALNYDGYITPAKEGFHCVGATFQPKSMDASYYPEDHQKNLANLRKAAPALYKMLFPDGRREAEWPLQQGRVAFRCQTPDYLPLIGPAPDLQAFLFDYAELRGGKVKRLYPKGRFLPNCFVNLAHGSRGITTSLFGAEIIASEMTGEPAPIDIDTLHAIHPARFIIRDLRRNKI